MIQDRKNFKLLESVLEDMSAYIARGDVTPVLLDKLMAAFPAASTAFVYIRDYERGPGFHLNAFSPSDTDLPDTLSIDFDADSVDLDKSIEKELSATLGYELVKVLPVIDNAYLIGFFAIAFSKSVKISSDDNNTMHLIATLIAGKAKEAYFKQRRYYARASLEHAIDNAGIDIYVTDFYTNEILYVNKSMAAPYGGPSNMLGHTCYLALYDDKISECEYCPKFKLIDENGNPTKLYSWDYQRPMDGRWFRVFSAAFEWEEGQLAHVITSLDITEGKQNELLVTRMALYDALTAIPNRRSFELDFKLRIERALNLKLSGYVLFLDLDNFKYINDAFGHEKGDELLIQVGAYLTSLTNEYIRAYRYGGDEFILIADNISEEAVISLTDTMMERFSQPWMLGELEYFCTASVGVANYPKDGITYDELLTAADVAMYSAKNSGKASVRFTDDSSRSSTKIKKEFALRKAILDDYSEFTLHYHPIVDTKTGRWAGTEVLARWMSPQFGTIYPEEFVPLCEDIGLIGQFEAWVLERALQDVSRWELKTSFFLSLNISTMQFKNEAFSENVLALTRQYKIPNVHLMIEIAASGPRYDETITKQLENLQANGILIALDGFGIGHSSLESIQNFKIDFIKVHKDFIMDFLDNKLKTTIVEAIVMIAHSAKAKVCAEGVESANHLKQLKKIKCDFVQGKYFQEPVPATVFIQNMKKQDSKAGQ